MSDEYFYGNYHSSYIRAFEFVIISAKVYVLQCISCVFSFGAIYPMDAAKSIVFAFQSFDFICNKIIKNTKFKIH